ncbi:hypothetical protein D3C76_1286010 [compost metagenome]
MSTRLVPPGTCSSRALASSMPWSSSLWSSAPISTCPNSRPWASASAGQTRARPSNAADREWGEGIEKLQTGERAVKSCDA